VSFTNCFFELTFAFFRLLNLTSATIYHNHMFNRQLVAVALVQHASPSVVAAAQVQVEPKASSVM
jgi:hypothetical protein